MELPRLVCWKPDRGPWETVRALSEGERGRLQVREAELAHALAPFGDDQDKMARLAITGLFNGFRFMRQQGESTIGAVGITLAVLREFPYWAIARGCLDIVQGRAETDKRFAPNDSEIYAVVANVVREHRRNLDTVRALLTAQAAEREPKRSGPPQPKPYPPSGRLASITPWRGDGNHAQRVAADLAARKPKNEGGEAAP